jgi:CrcB protein
MDAPKTLDLKNKEPSVLEEETRRAESIDRPPDADEGITPSKIYPPLSFPVIALLAPASIFGVLARLGLIALMSYDGHSVFPLAYVQAVGCLIMGMGLRLKEPIGRTCVMVSTFLTK